MLDWKNGFTATVYVVTGEIGGRNSWDIAKYAALRCMSAEQIRQWSADGIEFGAHSRTHPDLTTLGVAELEAEIAGSGRDLAGILGEFPGSFAYPYGNYNDAAKSSVEKAFQLAFTCEDGLNGPGTKPPLLLRTMVRPGDTLLEFSLRVRYGFNPVERWRARIRLRTRLRALFMREVPH